MKDAGVPFEREMNKGLRFMSSLYCLIILVPAVTSSPMLGRRIMVCLARAAAEKLIGLSLAAVFEISWSQTQESQFAKASSYEEPFEKIFQ